MKGRGKYGPYLAAGVTAFAVIAAAILLFFLLEHFSAIRTLLETIGYILRPICYGIVLAFLLLPVHRRILAVLTDQCQGIRDPWGKKKNILSAISILLSLILPSWCCMCCWPWCCHSSIGALWGCLRPSPAIFRAFSSG